MTTNQVNKIKDKIVNLCYDIDDLPFPPVKKIDKDIWVSDLDELNGLLCELSMCEEMMDLEKKNA